MKNNLALVILIILLIVIIVLLGGILWYFLSGNVSNNNGFLFHISVGNSKKIYENTFNLENKNKIEVETNKGNVKIKNGVFDEIKVEAFGEDEKYLTVEEKEDGLKIVYKENNGIRAGNNKNEIIVYIPNNREYYLDVQTDLGNINIDDFESSNVNVKSNCGNINISKVKNVNANADLGNINIDYISNRCDITADCGNVNIESLDIKENSNIKDDCGNIKIQSVGDVRVDAKTDLGNVKINGGNNTSNIILTVKNDMGNITIG